MVVLIGRWEQLGRDDVEREALRPRSCIHAPIDAESFPEWEFTIVGE